jgi:GNAT superfamily N-acetyltransferase
MVEIRISQLDAADVDGLDRAYAIYRDAILKSEQRPEAEFRALMRRPDYRFLVAARDTEIVGVAVSWAPAESSVWLFEYAAVAPHERGNGIGAHLFLASQALIGQRRVALIEVDADTGTEEQAKRMAFYRRLGCKKLRGLDYILPLDAFGTPPPMVLLVQSPPEATAAPVDMVEDWLRRIYFGVYGKRLDDPRLAMMIDPLPDDVELDPI